MLSLGLLMGGSGRRMGCRKETLLDRQGRSLLEHQLDRIAPYVSDLMLLGASEGLDLPSGVRAFPDPPSWEGLGPLSGLWTGLKSAQHPWLALLPIDCPNFPPEAFLQALGMVKDGAEFVGFRQACGPSHWLPGLYHRQLLPQVESGLQAGELSLRALTKKAASHYVSAASAQDDAAYKNLNTPQEAAELGFFVVARP